MNLLFFNQIGKNIDNIINDQPEDAAVMISFVILHEIFMHKKLGLMIFLLKEKKHLLNSLVLNII